MNNSTSKPVGKTLILRTTFVKHALQLSVGLALLAAASDTNLLAQYNGYFADIQPVPGLEHPFAWDYISDISEDGLTIGVTSTRSGSTGPRNWDTYQSTRNSVDEPFGAPVRSALSRSGIEDGNAAFSSDGLTSYFYSKSPTEVSDRLGLWTATRETLDSEWGEPQYLDGSAGAANPSLSSDDLTLYYSFSEVQDGGRSRSIFKMERASPSEPFGDAQPVSELDRPNRAETTPRVSSDELAMLYATFNSDEQRSDWKIMIATRPTKDDPFGDPVEIDDFGLGSGINSSVGSSWHPVVSADWPADGSKIYYTGFNDLLSDWDIYEATWSLPTAPEAKSLTVGETYSQNFDSLAADGAEGSAMPTGWTVTDERGVPMQLETNVSFPTSRTAIRESYESTFAFSAGPEGEASSDRSLAVYKPRDGSQSAIQLLADTDGPAHGLKIDFSVEAWDRIRSTPQNRDGGEAKFDVTIDMATGASTSELSEILGGEFTELLSLGTVTTGAVLPKPEGDLLDGNDPANRHVFETDVLHADIPAGARLRFRWESTGEADASEEWIFGIDDVSITLAVAGDTNLDGEVRFDDFLALADNFGEEGGWEQGDFDGNGEIEFPDFLSLAENFSGGGDAAPASVPEPGAASIALLGLLGLMGCRKRL